MKLLKQGNMKLDKSIAVFSQLSGVTCGRVCPGCYDMKALKRFPAVRAYREQVYKISQGPEFVDMVTAELTALGNKIKSVRVHEGGDFYSAEYVEKWAAIAERFPHLTFYAYTKRRADVMGIGAALLRLSFLPNFIVINSLKYGLNYGTLQELAPAIKRGAFLCPCGGPKDTTKQGKKICGTSCKYCQTKQAQDNAPVFIKH